MKDVVWRRKKELIASEIHNPVTGETEKEI
jgi:hypothetical protein